jgi:hypothetical protein
MPCSVDYGEFFFLGIHVRTLFQPPFRLTIIFLKHPLFKSSAAIAGVIDLLKTQGSFALSIRYALCLAMPSSTVQADHNVHNLQLKSARNLQDIRKCAAMR